LVGAFGVERRPSTGTVMLVAITSRSEVGVVVMPSATRTTSMPSSCPWTLSSRKPAAPASSVEVTRVLVDEQLK
jgi:hypothetical protein